VPAIPALAFALIVSGGLWCALWGTRWRLLGIVPIAFGLMLAPTGQRPDVFVGRGAGLVAVRGPDGKLEALAGRGSAYQLARWLEHDGDGRPPAEVAKRRVFRCDRLGCTAEVKGLRLAVASSAAALRDDCALAAILVLKFPRPRGCRPALSAIDSADVRARGAHALTIDGGKVRIVTVADDRGDRPWAPRLGAAAAPFGWDGGPPVRRRRRR
jgi:competence protein ComEC